MRLAILAGTRRVRVIKDCRLGAAGFAVHEVRDSSALAAIEKGEALEAGNHVKRRVGSKAPTKLSGCCLQDLCSFLLFLPRVDSDDYEQANDYGKDDERKKKHPHSSHRYGFATFTAATPKAIDDLADSGARFDAKDLLVSGARISKNLDNVRVAFGGCRTQGGQPVFRFEVHVRPAVEQKSDHRRVPLKRGDD